MNPAAARRIERTNYLLGAILVAVVAALGTGEQTLGVGVGAILSAINFTAIRRMVEASARAPEGEKTRPALFFVPKMIALMAAVALAVYFLPLSPVMLAVGFSVFLISIAIETMRFVAGRDQQDGAGRGAGDNSHG